MTPDASFGPFSVVTCFHLSLRHVFRKVEPIYTIKYPLVLKKHDEKPEKKLTYGPNDSFGPVFVVVALHWPLRTVIRSVVAIYISLISKNTTRKKKNSPMAQTTPDASFGPVLMDVDLFRPLRVFNMVNITYIK